MSELTVKTSRVTCTNADGDRIFIGRSDDESLLEITVEGCSFWFADEDAQKIAQAIIDLVEAKK